MNLQVRTTILWILLVFCFLLHGYYHVAELFYGINIALDGAKGEVPVSAHIFSIMIDLLPLTIGVAALYCTGRSFIWFSLIIALLLLLLNLVHLVMTVYHEPREYRQLVLLTLIIFINALLIKDLNSGRKAITAT